MPTFKNFTANVGQSTIPQGQRATADAFGGDVAKATEQLGGTGQKVAQQAQEHIIRKSLLETYRDAALLREKATRRLDELSQTGEPVNEQMEEFLQNELSEFQDTRSTERARQLAEQTSANIASDVLHNARAKDAEAAALAADQTVKATNQQNGVRLQSNPDILPVILDENKGLVESLEIPDNLKPALLRELNSVSAKNAIRGWNEIDPNLALEKLGKGEFDQWVDPDERATLKSRIETSIKQEKEVAAAKRVEIERQKKMESRAFGNELLVAAHSDDPEERLESADVQAAALKTFADGDPMLSAAMVNQLYTTVKERARVGSINSTQDALLFVADGVATGEVDTDDIDDLFAQGQLSASDWRLYRSAAEDGPPALRSVRKVTMQNISSFMGILPGMENMLSGFGVAETELIEHAMTREQELEKEGKSRLEYYTGGEFQRDARAVSRKFGLTRTQNNLQGQVDDLQPGEIMEVGGQRFRYNGGDKMEQDADGNFVNFDMVSPAEEGPDSAPLTPREVESTVDETTVELLRPIEVSAQRRMTEEERSIIRGKLKRIWALTNMIEPTPLANPGSGRATELAEQGAEFFEKASIAAKAVSDVASQVSGKVAMLTANAVLDEILEDLEKSAKRREQASQ